MQGKCVPTYWIELIAQENVSVCPSPTLAIPLDRNVTIKQCIRRPTISPFSKTENPLITISHEKNYLKLPNKKEIQSRYNLNRSISLTADYQTKVQRRRSRMSFSHGVSPSNVQLCMEASDSSDSDSDIIIGNKFALDSPTRPKLARTQSARVSIAETARLIHVRPWTADYEASYFKEDSFV